MIELQQSDREPDLVDAGRCYRVIILALTLQLFVTVGVKIAGIIAFSSDAYWLRHIVVGVEMSRPILTAITMMVMPFMAFRAIQSLRITHSLAWAIAMFVPFVSFFAAIALGKRVRAVATDAGVATGWLGPKVDADPESLKPWLFLYAFAFNSIALFLAPLVVRFMEMPGAAHRTPENIVLYSFVISGLPAIIMSAWIATTFPRPLQTRELVRLTAYCVLWRESALLIMIIGGFLGRSTFLQNTDPTELLNTVLLSVSSQFAGMFFIFWLGTQAARMLRQPKDQV